MRSAPAAALLLAATLAWAGAASGQPADFQNADRNGFGAATMDPYTRAEEARAEVEARFVLDVATLREARRLLLAFNMHSDDVGVRMQDARWANGTILPVESDERDAGARQTRLIIAPADLVLPTNGTVELVLKGTARLSANGLFHIGALVIAFDGSWNAVPGPDGGPAQLYAFTMLTSKGVATDALDAPFRGSGNTPVLLAVPAAGLAVVVLAVASLLRSRRT